MPHHSKHTHKQRKHHDSTLSTSSPGGYVNPQLSFQNSQCSMDEDCNESTGNLAVASWVKSKKVCSDEENLERRYYHGQYHRVPSSPAEDAGSEKRAQSGSIHDHDTVTQNPRNPRQEIASVLLLAAAAATNDKDLSISTCRKLEMSREPEGIDSHSNRPLKKRKSIEHTANVDVARNETNPDDACHVSPISHSSKSGATMESNVLSHDTPSTTSTHSFDMKDDSASGTNAERDSLGSEYVRSQKRLYQMIPQFPSVVHWILSESSTQLCSSTRAIDLSVLQWVAHGQAWRIIRWDAFHREVLPAIFPQLVSDVTATGSVDSFLWQLQAWGFQEIKDGPDVGAFAHTHFRRGHPKLCEKMKFVPAYEKMASSLSADSRSILRVPSLNSSTSATSRQKSDPKERSLGIVDYTGSPLHRHSVTSHPADVNKFHVGEKHGPPAYVNYRPEEMNLTPAGWQLSSKFNAHRNWNSTNPMVPSRLVGESGRVSTYSPIRIHSSRGRRHSLGGAGHVANNSVIANLSPSNESSETTKRSFPVSNRGMGRRRIVAVSTTKGEGCESSKGDELVMLANVKSPNSPIANEASESGVPIESKVPRSALKRKLPMMTSSTEVENVAH